MPLFTLGSIYSTYVSGVEQMPETTIQIELNRAKKSQLAEGKPAGYLQAWPRI